MPIAEGKAAKRIVHDGNHRYLWLKEVDGETAVSSVEAVTVTELGTFDDLSKYTPKDGVQGTPTFNRVSTADITSTFDSEKMGTWSFSPTFQLFIQHPDNLAFSLFTQGDIWLFLDFYTSAAAPVSGDPYYAMRFEVSTPVPLPFVTNENQRFQMEAAVQVEPVYTGIVAAA